VLDIDPLYIVYDTEIPDSLIKETKEYVRHLSRKLTPEGTGLPFEEGMRVKHAVFGEGTVERIDTEEEKAVFVRFDKMATVRGIALRAADKLTPLGKKE
jgi:DNA helicase-2/ATP-dependent DNA helicase PcrA